jgi:hypothetical protein
MDVSQDVLLEQIGGDVELLGRVRDGQVIEALLDSLMARAELAGRGLNRADITNLVSLLPHSAEEDKVLVATWKEREQEAQRIVQDGRRRSFDVVPVDKLPVTDQGSLRRGGSVDYEGADWKAIAVAAESYLATGGDPNDSEDACRVGRETGLSESDLHWLQDLFSDPISLSDDNYGNGRHRTEAMREAGVERIVINNHSNDAAARRKAALIRSGAPKLTPFEPGPPSLPSAAEQVRPGA